MNFYLYQNDEFGILKGSDYRGLSLCNTLKSEYYKVRGRCIAIKDGKQDAILITDIHITSLNGYLTEKEKFYRINHFIEKYFSEFVREIYPKKRKGSKVRIFMSAGENKTRILTDQLDWLLMDGHAGRFDPKATYIVYQDFTIK